mgnify:FL=1
MERDDAGAKAGAVHVGGGGLLGSGHRVQRAQRAVNLAHHEAVEIDFGGAGTADPSQHIVLFVDVDQRQKSGVLAVRHLQASVHFTAPGVAAGCAALLGIAFGNAHLVMLPPFATLSQLARRQHTTASTKLLGSIAMRVVCATRTLRAPAPAHAARRAPCPARPTPSRQEQLFRMRTTAKTTNRIQKYRRTDDSKSPNFGQNSRKRRNAAR